MTYGMGESIADRLATLEVMKSVLLQEIANLVQQNLGNGRGAHSLRQNLEIVETETAQLLERVLQAA